MKANYEEKQKMKTLEQRRGYKDIKAKTETMKAEMGTN